MLPLAHAGLTTPAVAGPGCNEGLGVDEAVVLCVRTDPEPVHTRLARQAEGAVVEADSCAVQLTAAEKLELQRWMPRIGFEQLEVLVGQRTDFDGQRVVAAPEPRGGCVIHRARKGGFL